MIADLETMRATCAPARGDGRVVILGVRVPGAQGRTPYALADVQLDGVVLTFGHAELKRGARELRVPADFDGNPAFVAEDDLRASVSQAVAAAVQADRAAALHLKTWRKRRVA